MNLVLTPIRTRVRALGSLFAAFSLFLTLGGCAPRLASPEQLAAFHAAGPARPAVDLKQLIKARAPTGPYRLVAGDVVELRVSAGGGSADSSGQLASPDGAGSTKATGNPVKGSEARPPGASNRVVAGDVLELTMPGVLRAAAADGLPERTAPYVCRVSEAGAIWLPIVGETPVAGKTLAEIEAALVAAYFPKHVRNRPAVVARVTEHRTFPVSVVGAVGSPGRYALRSDEMSLIALLMRAGGVARQGASAIRIRRLDGAKPVVVPIKGRDIPAADVALKSGDVVEVEPGLFGEDAYVCRVSEAGAVRLPVVGEVAVAGETLAETEAAVVAAYFPKYAATRPTVVARVAEHHTAAVSIAGAVQRPGTHALRSDEMCLVALLMKAGGIVSNGAGMIRIRHATQPNDAKPLLVPVKEGNIPFADVPLRDGDTVEVERMSNQVLTIAGLVNRAGTFPYPPDVQYNLAQALALGGGPNEAADPRYCSVYRKDADGKLAGARLKIGGTVLTEASNVVIKPGDIIVAEHTFRTRRRLFFSRVFHTGIYAGASYNIAQ